jgi:transcription-repair coupling factor (superfamily II helicase)
MNFLNDFNYENNIIIEGLTKELNIFYVLNLFKKENKNILIVTSTLYEANMLFSRLKNYMNNVYLFPMDDFLTTVALAISPEFKVKRLETLDKIKEGKSIVITNLTGYLKYLPDLKIKDKLELKINKGMNINRSKLEEILDKYGYNKESLVTTTGEYAVRGYVIDIFLVNEEHPIRIEFFGSEIDSIRYFNESTQLSIENTNDILITPNQEIKTDNNSSLYDYLNNPITIYFNESQIINSYKKMLEDILNYNKEINENKKYMFAYEEINPKYKIYINTFENNTGNNIINYDSKEIENFNSNYEKLKDYVNSKILKKKTVIFCLSKDSQIKIIKEIFVNAHVGKNILENNINIINLKINNGFEYKNYVLISEYDIENTKDTSIKYKNNYHIGKKIRDVDSLSLGDYVVHIQHGIGIYNGIITLNNGGIKKDYLQINYKDNDKVYIPVEKISTIYKYSDKDGTKPKINKLNSISWAKTKKSLQKKIRDISEELIKLYSIRNNIKGDAYIPNELEEQFGKEFEYELTKDQEKVINEIYRDLDSPVPMDRLLCGDVGFGKTEVAFRAIFRTILNNKQVCYLCPTTILSKQQYESALKRFENYPIEIALLNRFTTTKEVKRILNDLEKGTIDLVFGTHRLLSSDIKYKKLGLLVVDEEQRFGVTHKEKIKKYKNDVNVLTLSATPIPRTLKMAMSGLRDLSVIDTPPVDRYPVQTYVLQENDVIIKDAIYKELSRNGQIFILYNKVETIETEVEKIKKLVPEARIRYAHGQMNKNDLDDIMNDFVDYKFDILICTTIIETGIDIQNANTLIIIDADNFGLAQLYQIRGRVGRSNKIAYAYLLYNKNKVLNETSVKRLQAIKEFTELGSGYRIAMRDLSIRGAGDIIGSEQAGFVDTVGISLYMKMIEEEIKKLNGEKVEEEIDKPALVNVNTAIDDNYVSDEDLKIEIHQKINEIDSYDKLLDVKQELEDRFGKVSSELEIYMYEEWFEKISESLNINKVNQTERFVELELPENISSNIKADKLFLESYNINPNFKFKYFNKKIIISLPLKDLEKHFLYYFVPLLNIIKNDLEL